ncbi:NADPH:quinone reductase [Reichenbachiella faecimaris]|uniref:NADPH:quinone reductase n=1 Tax=Reichenbachiella faecimaris TaxID=692418 RepID=A0A1W2GMR5_REIFA|nr:zinc-binding dehydrogenase [Reichenbachiella faecimaris]SMD37854.1 NADPH:quinone reductase [Reichenbachiella faecimaris]
MKALLLVDESQDKIAIREIEKPSPNKGEVLIQVKAAALNHRDQWCRIGMYPGIKYNTVLGSDGAGIVVEVGEGVNGDWLKKEVIINPNINWGPNEEAQSAEYHILGMPTHGTFAEFVTVPTDRLMQKPSHLDFSEAAALPLGGLTAFRAAFTKGQIREGQKVLVTGIGGGVAQFAFQFALAVGSAVYVTSGSPEKLKQIEKLGAAGGFIYKAEDWTKVALKATGGFDVIIDSAGGSSMNDYLKLIKPGGRLVHYGSTTGAPKNLDMFRLFWSQASIHGSTMGSDKEFVEMVKFVSEYEIRPIVSSTREFDQIISAFDEMHVGSQMGKLVVTF